MPRRQLMSNYNDLINKGINQGKDMLDKSKDLINDSVNQGKDMLDKSKDRINDSVNQGKDMLDNSKDLINDSVNKGKDMLDKSKDLVSDSVNKGKDMLDKSKDLVSDGVNKVVSVVGKFGKITGEALTKAKGLVKTKAKALFKNFNVKDEAVDALAQFKDAEGRGETLNKLKSFGAKSTKGVKSLFNKIGDSVKKIGGKAITLGTEIKDKLKDTCGAKFAESQKKMMNSLETMYKEIDPNKLKDKVVKLNELTIDGVSEVAAGLKASTEKWTKWTKDSFTKEFEIPTAADIAGISCDGDCKAECVAVQDAAKSVVADMITAVENGQKSLQNAFTSGNEQSLGEDILSKMKGATDEATAQMQMMCSATESIGDQIGKLKEKADKVVKNYQSKFCSSASGKFAAASSSLLKCLFEKGQGKAIVNSPIRKKTRSILKAVESVSCKSKNGRKVDYRPKRSFKNVKFVLSDAEKALLKSDPSALKASIAEKIKKDFGDKADNVAITAISEARRRRLSANAKGEMEVTMTSDEGFSVDVSKSSVVSSYDELSPSFSGGSDLEVSTTSELSEGNAKGMSMLLFSLLLAQVAFLLL